MCFVQSLYFTYCIPPSFFYITAGCWLTVLLPIFKAAHLPQELIMTSWAVCMIIHFVPALVMITKESFPSRMRILLIICLLPLFYLLSETLLKDVDPSHCIHFILGTIVQIIITRILGLKCAFWYLVPLVRAVIQTFGYFDFIFSTYHSPFDNLQWANLVIFMTVHGYIVLQLPTAAKHDIAQEGQGAQTSSQPSALDVVSVESEPELSQSRSRQIAIESVSSNSGVTRTSDDSNKGAAYSSVTLEHSTSSFDKTMSSVFSYGRSNSSSMSLTLGRCLRCTKKFSFADEIFTCSQLSCTFLSVGSMGYCVECVESQRKRMEFLIHVFTNECLPWDIRQIIQKQLGGFVCERCDKTQWTKPNLLLTLSEQRLSILKTIPDPFEFEPSESEPFHLIYELEDEREGSSMSLTGSTSMISNGV